MNTCGKCGEKIDRCTCPENTRAVPDGVPRGATDLLAFLAANKDACGIEGDFDLLKATEFVRANYAASPRQTRTEQDVRAFERAFFHTLTGRQPREQFDDMFGDYRVSEVKRAIAAALLSVSATRASGVDRNAVLEEAAKACDRAGHLWDGDGQWKKYDAAEYLAGQIRALKSTANPSQTSTGEEKPLPKGPGDALHPAEAMICPCCDNTLCCGRCGADQSGLWEQPTPNRDDAPAVEGKI